MPESVDDRMKRMAASPEARSDPEFDKWLRMEQARIRFISRNEVVESVTTALIAGGLAYWAFWSIAHALLFAFMGFSMFAVGNRVISHMRSEKLERQKERQLDRLYGPADR